VDVGDLLLVAELLDDGRNQGVVSVVDPREQVVLNLKSILLSKIKIKSIYVMRKFLGVI
jgi:hypothetical protein